MIQRLEMVAGALFEYEEWLRFAKNGDTLIYFTGDLATDRSIELDEEDRSLDELRKNLGALRVTSARILSDAKKRDVILTQRRLDEGVYEYRATRVRVGAPPLPVRRPIEHDEFVEA